MGRLKFEDTDGDGIEYNVYNRKKEYLGWCQYDEDWKCWIFSSAESDTYGYIGLSADCMEQIVNFLKEKDKNGK